jgi:hypothetical protein
MGPVLNVTVLVRTLKVQPGAGMQLLTLVI